MNKLQASLAACAALFALSSQAALFDDTEARKKILEVEEKAAANHEQQAAQIEGLSNRTASQLLDMQNEMQQLKQDIAELRGALEVASHDLASLDKRQRDLYADTDKRLRKLETMNGLNQMGVLSPSESGAEMNTDAEAYNAYKDAYTLSQKASHQEALDAYNLFISKYPDSKYMPDAIYGLGYSQFAVKDYKASIATQQKLLAIYPNSAKAANAMYSIANSQIQLGQVNNAKKVLRELIAKYPAAAVTPNAQKRLKVLESIK